MTIRVEAVNIAKRFSRKSGLIERGLEALNLKKPNPVVHALDGVSISVSQGEVVGIVGESGCGKSTLGRVIAGLLEPSSGEVRLKNIPVKALTAKETLTERLKVQMIFQDPTSSLNPRQRLKDIIGAAPLHHGLTSRKELSGYVETQMRRAGLDPALMDRFPHQLSGGQRQRVGIARALAVNPDVLICDESVAALDVSIQAQVINLFMDLREELGLTYVFISHDLSVVQHISHRVVVMYLGRVVEEAPVEVLFSSPAHPYTRALLNERPSLDLEKKTYTTITGEIPSPLAPPSGCHFHPRCPLAMDRCRVERPALRQLSAGHNSACHLND